MQLFSKKLPSVEPFYRNNGRIYLDSKNKYKVKLSSGFSPLKLHSATLW